MFSRDREAEKLDVKINIDHTKVNLDRCDITKSMKLMQFLELIIMNEKIQFINNITGFLYPRNVTNFDYLLYKETNILKAKQLKESNKRQLEKLKRQEKTNNGKVTLTIQSIQILLKQPNRDNIEKAF